MKQKQIKRLFIFFIILLPLQYAVVGVVGVMKSEPWPAFVLPAFKSVFSTDDQIAVDQLKFYVEDNQNGSLIEVKPSSLFEGIQESQLQGFFRTHFSDSIAVTKLGADSRQWLKNQIKAQYPALEINHLILRWQQKVFTLTKGEAPFFDDITTNQFSITFQNE